MSGDLLNLGCDCCETADACGQICTTELQAKPAIYIEVCGRTYCMPFDYLQFSICEYTFQECSSYYDTTLQATYTGTCEQTFSGPCGTGVMDWTLRVYSRLYDVMTIFITFSATNQMNVEIGFVTRLQYYYTTQNGTCSESSPVIWIEGAADECGRNYSCQTQRTYETTFDISDCADLDATFAVDQVSDGGSKSCTSNIYDEMGNCTTVFGITVCNCDVNTSSTSSVSVTFDTPCDIAEAYITFCTDADCVGCV